MPNLTKLMRQYKRSKDKKLLNDIFIKLKNTIIDKSKFVFYKQNFFGEKEMHLCDTKQIELEDVIQDLNLFILTIINDNKIKNFEHYLNHSLKFYKPSFLNAEFMKNLFTQSIYRINEEGNEENLADKLPTPELINIEFSSPLTEKEQKVWELLQEDLNLSQEEIAEELSLSQKTISNVIASIKEKVKKI
jgi:DNA-directed RNA polymerase specialized sigma subunit